MPPETLPTPPLTPTTAPTTPDQRPPQPPKLEMQTRIIYFLLGLFFNIFATIPVLLWIFLKSKPHKQARLISFALGLLLSIILWVVLNFIVVPQLEKVIENNFPEIIYIRQGLQEQYPQTEISVNINYSKSYSSGQENTSESTLTVTMETDQEFNTQKLNTVGKQVCQLLQDNDDSYDQINITHLNQTRFLIFYTYQSYGKTATCTEWQNQT